ncbi:hypothetical protein J7384_01150 [Endozoicomonas sp. G2_1]|uniref:hypothetical protein n=1 Tax=Endozoicomonas sp. G2_1 TaxID=2821091 RepID=UPI001ADA99E0|nr:hypothetical protein [Endozoicomonas sp. G2_1]MBO9488957.1 hypothetical protein [Endozoicomonas sp. G2_1]
MTNKASNKDLSANTLPPKVLVETWVNIIRSSENQSARERAKDMLLGAFGDMQSVATYMRENGLS